MAAAGRLKKRKKKNSKVETISKLTVNSQSLAKISFPVKILTLAQWYLIFVRYGGRVGYSGPRGRGQG